MGRQVKAALRVMPTLEPDYLDPVLALPVATGVNLGHFLKLRGPQILCQSIGNKTSIYLVWIKC